MSRKKKIEPPEAHPFYEALGAARMGDPEGVHQMMFMFAEMCRDLGMLIGMNPAHKLPPLIAGRVAGIGKDCKALSEFADGYARGLRDANAKK